jgi:hypothetical protein
VTTTKKIEILLLAGLVGASFYQVVWNGNWQAGQYLVTLGAVLELEEWLRRS